MQKTCWDTSHGVTVATAQEGLKGTSGGGGEEAEGTRTVGKEEEGRSQLGKEERGGGS